ncbi:serine hydrolase domain-containing protein [Pontimicrobium sp. MEBiC01747]
MRYNKFKQLTLVALIVSSTITAQTKTLKITKPELVGMSSDSLEKMNTHFHRLVDKKQIAGIQTAIIKDNKLVHFNTYGYANIETKKPLDNESIFRIFSMTKPIVTVALMQLYEEGKFKLKDPLYKYLPMFKTMYAYTNGEKQLAKRPILVIDLLRHTSGFGYGRGDNQELNELYRNSGLWSATTNKEFAEQLSKLPLTFEPGTDWHYGVSTNICGYLVEVLSGKSLDNYLKECILKPLEMNDTHFQLPKEKIKRFTVGYRWTNETLTVSETAENNRYVEDVTLYNGGGGLVSTTLDYLKFCEMLLNKGKYKEERILKEETVALLFKDHMANIRQYQERFRLPLGEASFGLGFAIKGEYGEPLQKVYGWGGAVGTYFKIDTEDNLAYVLMIQLSPYRQLGLRQRFQDYVNGAIID